MSFWANMFSKVQKEFTVNRKKDGVVEFNEEEALVTALEYGQTYFTLQSVYNSFPNIDVQLKVVKPTRLVIRISRGELTMLEEHKSYVVSVELFDDSDKVIFPSDNLKLSVSFPTPLFYVNATTSNGTWFVVQTLTPGKGVIKAELKGVVLKDGSLDKEYQLQASLTVTVCQKIQIFPPFILLPSDSLSSSPHEIRLVVTGGTGHYLWATHNESALALSFDKEKSHVGYLRIEKEGDYIITVTDEENLNFLASAKISIQPVIDVETYPTVVEAEIGNVLILPVAFLAYEDKERRIIRKFDDCSKIAPTVEIIEKHVFTYEKVREPHVPAFGKGCRSLQFLCKYPGYSRINVYYESNNGNTSETYKTTTVLSCFKAIKPIHPVRVAVLPLGSSIEVAFEGGPRKWPLYKTGHYQKLEANNPKLVDIELVRDPIRYNKDLTVFRVLCKALGENTLTFHIGNQPSATNPHPANSESSIKLVCSAPQSAHLKLFKKNTKKEVQKENLVKVSDHRFPFTGLNCFSVDVWFKDSMGRKLYNISSLTIRWSVSNPALAAPQDTANGVITHDNAVAGYRKISRDFKEFKMTGGAGQLEVRAEMLGYRNDVLEKAGVSKASALKSLSGSIDLDLVSLRDINAGLYQSNEEKQVWSGAILSSLQIYSLLVINEEISGSAPLPGFEWEPLTQNRTHHKLSSCRIQ
ncbi:nuclear pore membrane glycoprotein 210-like [Caerostris extrusa]|uniref:Nuclear pore membrane glycoprotein 210-like n=1 Tax=Caerostris extrusa TaxID=172846 RepID=A0AAV4P5C3_CAEEX|nr:nuclear pore membrane glycoprotein 210-like [Caerostris extrusa]